MIPQGTVMVSGGFSPLHIGHIQLFQAASHLGKVTVVVNSDAYLKRKKGYPFMPWEHRAKIIQAIRYVSYVSAVDDSDGTIREAISRLRPSVFCTGEPDNQENPTPEYKLCRLLNIQIMSDIGGSDKSASNSDLVRAAMEQLRRNDVKD